MTRDQPGGVRAELKMHYGAKEGDRSFAACGMLTAVSSVHVLVEVALAVAMDARALAASVQSLPRDVVRISASFSAR